MKYSKKFLKIISILLSIVLIVPGFLSVNSFSEVKNSDTVYVSDKDIHYHTENCSCLGTNKIATTVDFAVSAGFTACEKCNPPKPASTNTAVSKSSAATTNTSAPAGNVTYILNKNTKKFHYPTCSSVSDMKEKNKIYFTGTRDEIPKGYVACKKCKP